MVNYKDFRLNKLNTPEYRHLLLLLYYPLYLLIYIFTEKYIVATHLMHCFIDDIIPFCEYFIIPYVFWYIYVIGAIVFSMFYDVETFKKTMKFIIFTYTLASLIIILYPNYQDMRPVVFERDNIFTKIMGLIYATDTNTNVFPSVHVIGSFAALLGFWNLKMFKSIGWKILFIFITISICASTMFLKQHSFLDFLGALPICAIGYVLFFWKGRKVKNNN